MVKPTKLLTNMVAAHMLQRNKPSPPHWPTLPGTTQRYLRRCPSGPAGGRDLQSSADYTPAFVYNVFVAWEREYVRGVAPYVITVD